MNKKVLIISPYFAPVNGADMHRIRMSLPYFKYYGWDAEVVMIHERFANIGNDPLLLKSIPPDIKIHKVSVISKRLTSIIGLGSIGLRSLWHYRKKVNQLLQNEKFDLLYFSTTQFPVFILGAYWKKKFDVPYVIDMQDPWHSDYYQTKARSEKPAKYWFSYRLNKYLEPLGVENADGIISVSADYINTLLFRYSKLRHVPTATITFGSFDPDMQIASANQKAFNALLDLKFKNIVYIGRGGIDMHKSIGAIFAIFKTLLQSNEQWAHKIKFHFIGTSYAASGHGKLTILPLAVQFGVADYVVEVTDRIGYYHALATLQMADALFIPGSDDPKYTASKIYPYILTKKPLLAVFNAQSPALQVLYDYGVKDVYDYDNIDETRVSAFFKSVANGELSPTNYNNLAINNYSAREMTLSQCVLFDEVIYGKN